jgi:hypothetical protein
MKKKQAILVLLLLTISTQVFAISKMQQGVINQANKMANAYLSKHYITYAQFAYNRNPSPKADTDLAELVEKHIADMHQQKNDILSMSFSQPTDIINQGGLLQCAVPVKIVTRIGGGTLTRYTNMIAISRDKGKHWKFMDTGGKSLEAMQKQYPELSGKIILLPLPNETFEPDRKPE